MKKIIVIQVPMESEKCRRKALKTAAKFQGVLSVSLEGESRDQVVVTGDGIDSVCLTNKMRKKFCHATLVSVVDENVSSNDNGGGGGEEQREEETNSEEKADDCHCAHNYINYPPPPCPSYYVVYDPYGPYPNSSCSIL